jgi:hypothetical protein
VQEARYMRLISWTLQSGSEHFLLALTPAGDPLPPCPIPKEIHCPQPYPAGDPLPSYEISAENPLALTLSPGEIPCTPTLPSPSGNPQLQTLPPRDTLPPVLARPLMCRASTSPFNLCLAENFLRGGGQKVSTVDPVDS